MNLFWFGVVGKEEKKRNSNEDAVDEPVPGAAHGLVWRVSVSPLSPVRCVRFHLQSVSACQPGLPGQLGSNSQQTWEGE